MTKLVTGIGGLFFRAKDNKNLTAWYEKHFGLNMGWQQEAGPTVFAPFKEDTNYFGRKEQQFMLNLRVSDLAKLLDQLKKEGVKMDEKVEEMEYGKFAWVYDPEGNKIELWQPAEESK
jgi:glyoxylase I family protein